MSLPKQIKSVRRCWMSKRSGKSLTEIGYNVTLDSNLRAYRDYHIQTFNRNKCEVIQGSSESISKDSASVTEDVSSDAMERQFSQGVEQLKNFKKSNNIPEIPCRGTDGGHGGISWAHHYTDYQSSDEYPAEGTSPEDNPISSNIQVYEGYFYGCKHWNFFTLDDDIEAVILSLKVELLHGKEYIR